MKKFFTLLSAVAIAAAANAQTYFSDDFEGGTLTANHAWTSQVIANPDVINGNWVLGTSGGNYAKLGNYVSSTNHILNSWFISPAIDLSAGTDVNMSFKMTKRFAGDDMVVHISNDYDGSSAPSTATWTDITSLFTLDTDIASWTFTNSGDGDISTYISGTSTYIAFEYIGSDTDGSTWEVDNISIQEGATVTPITTIYDIQYTSDLAGNSTFDGQEVTTIGVVTGVVQIGTNADRFFIQDGDGAWNGIYVYENGYSVEVGDSVKVTGTVDEYFTLTEIVSVTDVTIISSGNPLPNPVVVTNSTAGEEQYEGVMVTLEYGLCLTAADIYGAWTINDGTNPILTVDDDLLPTPFSPVVGDGYDVTGVKHFAFDEHLILPSSSSQIVTVAYATLVDNENNFEIYPNPATDMINLRVDANAVVAIYSVTGAKVLETVATKTLDISSLEAGIYNVVVTLDGAQTVEKLIVR